MITLHFNDTTLDVQESDDSYRYRSIMGDHNLTLKFSLSEYVEIPVGAWCEYMATRYTLAAPANITKNGTRDIEYTLIMESAQYQLNRYKIRNTVDKRLKFSMCATPKEYIQVIVDNLNQRDSGWTVGDCIVSTEKTIAFDHSYVSDALQSVADTFNTEWEIVGKTIHLKKVEYFKDEPLPLSYGKGNGFVPGVGRTTETGSRPVEKLFVQGGSQNIDRSKYGSAELLLPKSQTLEYEGHTYISDADGYSIRRQDKEVLYNNEDSLDCSEIYPSRIGKVTKVEVIDEANNFYDIIDSTIPESLNYNDYLIEGENMTIIFQSGMLAGDDKAFELKYNHAERRFEIVPQEIDGLTMPGGVYIPHEGDTYAIFGCMLPDAYICDNETKTGASWDMFREAARYLYENEETKFTFSGELQGMWAKRNWQRIFDRLIIGGYVLFSDNQFAPDGVPIRITGIKNYLTSPYAPTIELSNTISGKSLNSTINDLENDNVIIDGNQKKIIQFTKRRFRDTEETISMLEAAFKNFTGSIQPVSVQTMQLLIGDESLQFRFVTNKDNPVEDSDFSVLFSKTNNRIEVTKSILQHMTLGIDTLKSNHDISEYHFWDMESFVSQTLDQNTAYYLYAKVSKHDDSGIFIISENHIDINSEDNYYHLLVGIINSEYEGDRSFAPLYGFSEVSPARITTREIAGPSGYSYINLETGSLVLQTPDKGAALTYIDGVLKIGDYDYLRQAFINSTTIDGGVIQSTKLSLGYNDGTIFHIMSGTNGQYDNKQLGGGIAAWWGGDMIDRESYQSESDIPDNAAKAVIRFDGTGYLANGNIRWDSNGTVYADPLSFFVGESTVGLLLASFQIIPKDGDKNAPDYIIQHAPFREVQIGDAYLKYDKTNNAVYVEGSDGSSISFYATGSVSSYGVGNPQPGFTGSLVDLVDVAVSGLKAGDILKYDGTHFVNVPISSIAGASSWEQISGKPDYFPTLWSEIKDAPESLPASDVYPWAKAATKPSYNWDEITDKPSVFTPDSHTHVWANITDRPTKLSQFQDDVVDGNYFKLSAVRTTDLNDAPINSFFVSSNNPANSPASYTTYAVGLTLALNNDKNFKQQLIYTADNWYYRSQGGGDWYQWHVLWSAANFNPSNKLDKSVWDEAFEIKTVNGIRVISAKLDVLGQKGISAYADSADSGSAGGSLDYELLKNALTGTIIPDGYPFSISSKFLGAIDKSYITGKIGDLYADAVHTHKWTDITDRPTSLPANGGNADSAIKLNNSQEFDFSTSALSYLNLYGPAGSGVLVNDCPTNDWWHILRCLRADVNGYYTDIAVPMNGNALYWKRVWNGTLQNNGWVKIWDSVNLTKLSQLQDDVVAGKYLPLAGGTMKGILICSDDSAYIAHSNEPGAALIQFAAGKTVIGSIDSQTYASTHIRSISGHATVGKDTNGESYTIWDSGNFLPNYKFDNFGVTLDSKNEVGNGYTLIEAGATFSGPFLKWGRPDWMFEFYSPNDINNVYLRNMFDGAWQNPVKLWHSANLNPVTTDTDQIITGWKRFNPSARNGVFNTTGIIDNKDTYATPLSWTAKADGSIWNIQQESDSITLIGIQGGKAIKLLSNPSQSQVIADFFVGTATKARQDESGNSIADSYLRLTGGTLTGSLTTQNITANGTVTANKFSGPLSAGYTGNGGQQGPGYVGMYNFICLMMNTSVNGDYSFKNWLLCDAYAGSDVGGATAIGVSRQNMKVFAMSSNADRTAWNRTCEIYTTENANRNSVDWTARNITAAGTVTAPTFVGKLSGASSLLNINNDAGQSSVLQFMQMTTQNEANDLPSNTWHHVLKMNHGNGDTYFSRSLAFSFFDNGIYTRYRSNGTAHEWVALYGGHNANRSDVDWTARNINASETGTFKRLVINGIVIEVVNGNLRINGNLVATGGVTSQATA